MEWDEEKSDWNRERRGFGFEIAYEFDWDNAVTERDDRKDYGETRYRAFGRADDINLVIAFTVRNRAIRIISVRRMNRREARRYDF